MAKSVAAGIWRLQDQDKVCWASVVCSVQRSATHVACVPLRWDFLLLLLFFSRSLCIFFDGRTLSPAGSHTRDTASGAKLSPSAPVGWHGKNAKKECRNTNA